MQGKPPFLAAAPESGCFWLLRDNCSLATQSVTCAFAQNQLVSPVMLSHFCLSQDPNTCLTISTVSAINLEVVGTLLGSVTSTAPRGSYRFVAAYNVSFKKRTSFLSSVMSIDFSCYPLIYATLELGFSPFVIVCTHKHQV